MQNKISSRSGDRRSNRRKTLIHCYLFIGMVILLAAMVIQGCGGGGGGSDSGGGVEPTTSPTYSPSPTYTPDNEVYHQSGTTGNDGSANFSLNNGVTVQARVVNCDDGKPISDISIVMITDDESLCYLVSDPSGKYLPRIVNSSESGERYIGLAKEIWLTCQDKIEGYQPVSVDLIPDNLSKYVIKYLFLFQRSCELNNLGPTIEDLGWSIGENVVEISLDLAANIETGPVGWAITAVEFVNDTSLSAWQIHYTNLGYASDQVFEIYRPNSIGISFGLSATLTIVLPTEEPAAPPGIESYGTIKGKVVNAISNEGLSDVEVKLYPSGKIFYTSDDGSYVFSSIPPGDYQIIATKYNFFQNQSVNVHLFAESALSDVNVSLSPIITNTGETRIVLTWGTDPCDIDAHLWTPDINGSEYHIYTELAGGYWGDSENPPYAALDVDDLDGLGPETVTISKLSSGYYLYSVFNFRKYIEATDTDINYSNAKVEVYNLNGKYAEFNISDANGSGLWWNVFWINGNTGEITPINTINETASNSWSYSSRNLDKKNIHPSKLKKQ